MGRLNTAQSGPWIAITGLVLMLWLVLASVLFAPWWGVVTYIVLWLATGALTLGLLRPWPGRSMWVPVAGMLIWFAIALAGARWWDWAP